YEKFIRARPAEKEEGIVKDVLVMEEETKQFEDGNLWYFYIENFFRDWSFTKYVSSDERKALRRIAQRYKILWGLLHRRVFTGLFLRCITDEECLQIIEVGHTSESGGHINGQAFT